MTQNGYSPSIRHLRNRHKVIFKHEASSQGATMVVANTNFGIVSRSVRFPAENTSLDYRGPYLAEQFAYFQRGNDATPAIVT